MSVRCLALKPLAARCPTPQRCHVGLGPCLVDEDQPSRIDAALTAYPSRPLSGDVRAVTLAGDLRLFLCVSSCAWTNAQTDR